MTLPRLWTRSQELTPDPFRAMRREMENAFRAFDQNVSTPEIGAGAPAINVAETKDAFEVTAELPGVDEKDIKVSLDAVSYTHLRAHETDSYLVCRLLLEKK